MIRCYCFCASAFQSEKLHILVFRLIGWTLEMQLRCVNMRNFRILFVIAYAKDFSFHKSILRDDAVFAMLANMRLVFKKCFVYHTTSNSEVCFMMRPPMLISPKHSARNRASCAAWYSASISQPVKSNPNLYAAMRLEPLPTNGSNMVAPSFA